MTNDLVKQHKIPPNEVVFRFQVESTKVLLRNRLQRLQSKDPIHKAHVLSAGVGSGKTLGFTLMALIDAVWNREWFNEPAISLNEGRICSCTQGRSSHETKRQKSNGLHVACPTSKFGLSTAAPTAPPGREQPLACERSIPEMAPPAIIITTFETLKRRMRRPEFIASMARWLNSIVVDEVHLLLELPAQWPLH